MSVEFAGTDGIRVALDASVLRVQLDSPSRRNALRDDAVRAFAAALTQANNDERVRAVLVTGAHGHFCAGADIVDRNAGTKERPRVGAIARRLPSLAHGLVPTLMSVQIPVVAGVRGFAVGLGMQLAMACDFAVVSRDATFWEPFAERGMGPDGGASWLLPRLVGPVRARELLLLGRRLTGAEAVEWGLAYRAVADDDVETEAESMARRLADGPTVALGITKLLVNQSQERSFVDHLGQEAYGMELSSRSPDFREGLTAFIEKRDPRFSGK